MKSVLPIPAFFLALLFTAAVHAAPAAQLDSDAQAALNALYASSPAAKALGERAKAVLVFPDVRKAALLVGAETGPGVMFEDAKVAGHYRLGGVQAGLEAGAESFSYALFFMSDAALEGLRASHGIDIGVDPNIVFVNVGATKEISTATVQPDIYGFVYGQEGLMAGVSLQGVKITQLDD